MYCDKYRYWIIVEPYWRLWPQKDLNLLFVESFLSKEHFICIFLLLSSMLTNIKSNDTSET